MGALKTVLPPLMLLIVAIACASFLSPNFLDARYLLDSSTLYVEIGLVALGLVFVIVSGHIDLSVASMIALTGCLVAKVAQAGNSLPTIIGLAVLVGASLGAANGVLVAWLRLPAFLVTLATMAIYRGAAQAMMGAKSIELPDWFTGIDQSLVAGIPSPIIVFLAFALCAAFLLHSTVFGRWVYAVGANASAARYSAVPVERVTVSVFMLTGALAGVGALLLDSRLGVARHDLARGAELDAITVAVLGGCAIEGGRGTILGPVLALILVVVIKTAMGVANVKTEYQLTALGAILVVAVLAQRIVLPRRRIKAPTLSSGRDHANHS